MRAVVQRTKRACVVIEKRAAAGTSHGMVVFLGIENADTEADVQYICEKIIGLRIFEDDEGKMNLSIKDIGGEILLISQFTLLGDVRKGRRPNFTGAARPETAIPLYEEAIKRLNEFVPTKTGEFGAHMEIELVNDGPVTILLDSRRLF